ncbi:flagellar protein FlgN [Sphingomonas sp. KRR8]|uniref:flagellar protein FlgN n=1 Tax=Sphingomonas sp. KRR8 TaxID=2942996 RepID=UPI002021EBAF|nr:flagellar protein FlgN [Sphingomonas sp. KRR8]URD61905.1 flagellar protein FlgN [Sphingomonas sp. KRR8]
MSATITDTIRSLTSLMLEETRLLSSGWRAELGELASAKLRLTASLEKQVAARQRDNPDWQDTLQPEEKAAFIQAVDEMQQAARENGQRLLRQIELSRDLMDAIVSEARRIDGHESSTYGARGGLQRFELPAPISINARL